MTAKPKPKKAAAKKRTASTQRALPKNAKARNSHIFARDPLDYYVEPHEVDRALFAEHGFHGGIYDPACGSGRIIKAAQSAGAGVDKDGDCRIIGSDISPDRKRLDACVDFLSVRKLPSGSANIVCNPPFNKAEAFVLHALELVEHGKRVAMLLPLSWLCGFSRERPWMPESPLEAVYAISPRPSMLPGDLVEQGVGAGGGKTDFGWFVWRKGYLGKTELKFLNTTKYRWAE